MAFLLYWSLNLALNPITLFELTIKYETQKVRKATICEISNMFITFSEASKLLVQTWSFNCWYSVDRTEQDIWF